jgi:hypothetical protein
MLNREQRFYYFCKKFGLMELSLDMNKRYTYADYLTWLDGQARELINGFIKIMSPAPRLGHAKVNSNIFGK